MITTKSIEELKGYRFYIPDYQRGYRWTIKQVTDLLEDIKAFKPSTDVAMYCLQPLVVKSCKESDSKNCSTCDHVQWEVIDGQQRLTTINILLNSLSLPSHYFITYQTRANSQQFLVAIDPHKKGDNIDYYHIVQAKQTIDSWFQEEVKQDKDIQKTFTEKLLKKVKFIWYDTDETNPITVFTRMNIGKIALTNAELVKALVLNDANSSRLSQQKIAIQWDTIENTLENDEFWYFLNKKEDSPLETRIDFILDIIRSDRNIFPFNEVEHKGLDDRYRVFQYFYDFLEDCKKKKDNGGITIIWDKVLEIYYAFDEWYNHTELYHYIGFLIECGKNVNQLLDEWFSIKYSRKDQYIADFLKPEISKIVGAYSIDFAYETKDHNEQKTKCRPILLLYNIQFIINENKQFKENSKFKAIVHRRFPFHLYKAEVWNVEHIGSATDNSMSSERDRVSYLWTSMKVLEDIIPESDKQREEDEQLKTDIGDYLQNVVTQKDEDAVKENAFDQLFMRIENRVSTDTQLKGEDEKNRVWNFALLDETTNKSYKNAIFPAKRRIIIERSMGRRTEFIHIGNNGQVPDGCERIGKSSYYVKATSGHQSFVPQCTLNAFLKFHSMSSGNLLSWTKEDAEAYKKSIIETLEHAHIYVKK